MAITIARRERISREAVSRVLGTLGGHVLPYGLVGILLCEAL
jgi:hypothetical protein